MYRVTDRLHAEHSVEVPCHDIAATVSTWLAELGAHTALVESATGPRLMPSAIACPSMCPLRHEPPRGDRATNHVRGQPISLG